MMKLYLSKDGVVRVPTAEEKSHYGMAKTILGGEWRGNTEDAHAAMWQAGWVRVVETATKVNGEQYLKGKPVPFKKLTPQQQKWFQAQCHSEEKQLIWNDQKFAITRSQELPVRTKRLTEAQKKGIAFNRAIDTTPPALLDALCEDCHRPTGKPPVLTVEAYRKRLNARAKQLGICVQF